MTALQGCRILVVDDEEPARHRLCDLLETDSGVHSFRQAANGEEAVRMIRDCRPDLVLLDVQMPGLNGLQVVEKIGAENMPMTAFITAFNQHALRAFDDNALDYLLNPFSDERFAIMMARARAKKSDVQLRAASATMAGPVRHGQAVPRYLDRFAVKVKETIRFVLVRDVVWIAAAGVYVTINAAGERILYRISLAELERSLDPLQFLRVHRSAIVNIDCIAQLQVISHGEFDAVLVDGSTLRVSRTYRDAIEKRLGQRL